MDATNRQGLSEQRAGKVLSVIDNNTHHSRYQENQSGGNDGWVGRDGSARSQVPPGTASSEHYRSQQALPTKAYFQLLDVFSVKQNINLVLEYLDTDLEAIIKDKALVFQQGDIKSWMAMSLRGLEYIHRNGVLHRVSTQHRALTDPCRI
jgi:serine/threonine protein kinase